MASDVLSVKLFNEYLSQSTTQTYQPNCHVDAASGACHSGVLYIHVSITDFSHNSIIAYSLFLHTVSHILQS